MKTQVDVPTIGVNNCEFDTRGQKTQNDRKNELYSQGTHYTGGSQLYQLLERQTLIVERQQAAVERFTMGMELPKREFLFFDGNPINYSKFMRNFELNVENRVQDASVRLSYLIQYTGGKARDAIQNCVILPEVGGYLKAKEILRKNFG